MTVTEEVPLCTTEPLPATRSPMTRPFGQVELTFTTALLEILRTPVEVWPTLSPDSVPEGEAVRFTV